MDGLGGHLSRALDTGVREAGLMFRHLASARDHEKLTTRSRRDQVQVPDRTALARKALAIRSRGGWLGGGGACGAAACG